MTSSNSPSDGFTPDQLDARIRIVEPTETIELDLTGLVFKSSDDANAFYDRLEARIADTGEDRWFFITNVSDYRVWQEAWFAYTRRGKETHAAHSMATVHVDTSEVTARRIARDAGTEAEDKTLFSDWESARAAIRARKSTRRERIVHTPNYRKATFTRRLTFRPSEGRFDIDLSGIDFAHSRDVNDIFNWMEEAIRATGRKWWFLINYTGMRIQSGAWVAYDQRKAQMERQYALGVVRYAPDAETETDIRLRMESRGTRPNIRNTRDAAIERLGELKAAHQD
ncbi:hypothetical protein [Shimia ponticola]|uniref:hypothetical protein n=1 Tax=Shimia ponticola TaxID=2582893 RepID=UPI0011BF85E8|nr:hypothetical protein [Shimia ponticola]